MLALCANYEGTVPENQEAFDHYIETVSIFHWSPNTRDCAPCDI